MSVLISILLRAITIVIYNVESFTKMRVVGGYRLLQINMNLILIENENNKFFRELSGIKSLNNYSGYDERNFTTIDVNFIEMYKKYEKMKKLEKINPVFIHPTENGIENEIQITNILNGGLMDEFKYFI